MELCICSVADLYPKLVIDHEDLWLIKAGLGIRSILRQATEGLAFLHGSGHIHRNIKPSNFLVAKIPSPQSPSGMKYLIKICDFRLSKLLSENNINSGTKGSDGWTAPESAKKGIELTYQYDTFILGCFFYWLIKDGEHPFGEPSKRFMNMLKPKYPTYANLPDIDDQLRPLISRMIQYDSSKRPALTKILNDSYFQEINYSLYDAPNVKPGLIVIINEQEFAPEVQTKLANRKGSEHDVRNLENVFRNFGFDVRIKENLSAFDLDTYLSDLAKENFTQYASLVICVLSHGHQGAVYGTDGKSVALNTIKFKFNIEDCPSMQDKPKIFVFQACQSLPPSMVTVPIKYCVLTAINFQ
jgi:serine/threonine protein kinase